MLDDPIEHQIFDPQPFKFSPSAQHRQQNDNLEIARQGLDFVNRAEDNANKINDIGENVNMELNEQGELLQKIDHNVI